MLHRVGDDIPTGVRTQSGSVEEMAASFRGGTQCERRSEESGLVRMIAEFVTQTERYYLVRQECIEMEASPLQGARSVDKGTHQKSAETSRDETITD